MKTLRPLLSAALLLTSTAVLAEKPTPPPPTSAQQNESRPHVDVAFVLDTTGSMGGLLEGAKQKIWSIASNIARGKPAPILRVAVVAYRDVGDAYVAKRFDLTRDLDGVHAYLQTLNADGGGDTPEHVGRGLGEAVSKLEWSDTPNTMKMIFVVGDAPPQHYSDGWDVTTWAQRAKKKGILVNTIRCGGDLATQEAFTQIASLADGSYASIDASGGMVAVHTPYDAKLAELNSAIASRTLYGGEEVARKRSEVENRALATMDAPAAADRLSYGAGAGVSSAPKATGGAVDITSRPEVVAKMPEESLPEPVRAVNKEDRRKYVEKLARERTQFEDEAKQIAAKREAWVKDNVKESDDAFDTQVLKKVRSEGAKYGIAY